MHRNPKDSEKNGEITVKFDMHCHTKEGSIDGHATLEETIELLKENGYNGMLITDHNSYGAYRHWKKTIKGIKHTDFVVLKGIEYDTIDCGHILVILPHGVKVPILELRGLPVSILIEIVHYFGGILGPAHPCGEKYLSFTNTKRGKKFESIISRFDFVEGFNACESEISNYKAKALAKKYNKPCFGGSDSHRTDCVGLGYTEIDAQIKDETDLIKAVQNGVSITASGSYYTKTTKQKIGKLNHVLVYSFWFYNKGLGLLKKRKRKIELLKEDYIQLQNKLS